MSTPTASAEVVATVEIGDDATPAVWLTLYVSQPPARLLAGDEPADPTEAAAWAAAREAVADAVCAALAAGDLSALP